MVKRIEYVECDCGGHIEKFAETRLYSGPQYEDPSYQTIFYQCLKCKKIYYDEYNGCDTREYKGKLTYELIKKYANQFSGRLDNDDIKEIFVTEGRTDVSFTKKLHYNRATKNFEIFGLPMSWNGKFVKISIKDKEDDEEL